MINNKKILILGGARSGIAASKVLKEENEVILTDIKELTNNLDGVKVIITNTPENIIDESFDLIVKSPGVPETNKAIIKAKELNIKVINEVELAYSFIPKETFIIGITGSNGKTTTTTMVYEILKKMNKNVVLGGNIGIPLCDALDKITQDTILVLEISDHQLLNMYDFKTNISLLTNLCPTHLDFHGTYENYVNVKRKIFNNHTNNDIAFINKGNEDSMKYTNNIKSNTKYFNNKDEKNYYDETGIYINNELIITLEDIMVVGNHNYENILSALMIINEFGIDKAVVKEFLKEFKGVEHRIEYVTNINNVRYYNDSKATNPTSTLTAINTFNKPIHLILGGMERSQNFNELNEVIHKVKYIYAIGEVTDRIVSYAKEQNIKVFNCYNLESAVNQIKENKDLLENEIVLLSPACASWDQYAKFEDRGNEFKKLVIEK